MKKPLDQVRIRGAGYKPVLDDVPQYTPSTERVKDTPEPTPTHECNIKILCTLEELNQLQVGVWSLAKTSNEPKVMSWTKKATQESEVLLSAKCLSNEEKSLLHDVFVDAGHITQQTITPKPINSSHIHAEYIPVKLMVQFSESGLAWATHGYYYHFLDGVLAKEYKVAGNDRWSCHLTRSKALFLSDELLSDHHYTSILLPYKVEEKSLPPQHILFRTEKLTSEELANINHAWLEENAVTLDIEQLVSIRQTDLLERPKDTESQSDFKEKSAPTHTVKTHVDTGQSETWTDIAAQYGLAPKELLTLNPLYEQDPLSLKVGDKLQVRVWQAPEQCSISDQPHPIKTIEKAHSLGDVWGKYQHTTINDKLVNISQDQSVSANTPVINATHTYWPAYNFLAKEGEKQIEVIYRSQTAEIAIFTPEEWKKLFEIWDFNGDVKTVKDSLTGLYNARETAKALGGLGVTAIVKNIDGVEYLYLNNYDKFKQTILHGGVFRADNPQVVKMGMGALDSVKGMTRYVKTYAPAEFLLGSGINGLKYLLTDDYTLRELGVDEAKLLVHAVSVAGTALVLGKIVAFGAGLLSLPVTIPVSLSILAFSAFGVWFIDKETDFEKRLVEAVVDEFDGE
ncbi:hypothetical protein ACH0R5_004341 [Vibrio vulnificus]